MVLVPITAELSLERSTFEILALQGKRVSVRHPLISESLKPESPNISTPRAHTTGLSYGKRPSLDAVWPPPWETDVKRCSVSTIVQDVPAEFFIDSSSSPETCSSSSSSSHTHSDLDKAHTITHRQIKCFIHSTTITTTTTTLLTTG
jgi:hypothetical protein